MAKEFVIKNGLIINGTHPITGITNDSGFTNADDNSISTSLAIKNYVDVNSISNIESSNEQIIFNSGGTLSGSSNLIYNGTDINFNNGSINLDTGESFQVGSTTSTGSRIGTDGFGGFLQVGLTNSSRQWYFGNINAGLYIGKSRSDDPYISLSSDGIIFDQQDTIVNRTTTSTSKDTGALVVEGGVGIEENIFIGNNLSASKGFTNTQTLGINQEIYDGSSNNVVIGDDVKIGNFEAFSNNVVVGYSAYSDGDNTVIIGYNSYSSSDNSILIGSTISTDRKDTIALGNNIYTGGPDNIFIGNDLSASDVGTFESIGIGNNVYVEKNNSVVIGYNSFSTSENDIVIGSNSWTDLHSNDGNIIFGSHSIISSVGDNVDFQIGNNMVKITVSDLTQYTTYENVSGGTSGATGVIERKDTTNDYLWIRMTSLIDFLSGETLYGLTSGESQTINSVDIINNNIQDVRFNRGLETISIDNPLNININSIYGIGDSNQIIFNSGGTLTGSSNLTWNDNSLIISGNTLKITEPRTITSSGDTGEIGEISWDENYIYICVEENTWKRTSLASW